jgi:hypothetical protein
LLAHGPDLSRCSFLASDNLYSVAEAKGWWKPGEPFDFTAVYSGTVL